MTTAAPEPATTGLAARLLPGGDWDVRQPAGRAALIRAGDAGDQDAADVAWAAWLADSGDEDLRQALKRWRRQARWQQSGPLTEIAMLFDIGRRVLIAEAAARAGELSGVVRDQILAEAADQALIDQVCERAIYGAGEPQLAAWCAAHGLAPAADVRRAVFFLLTGQSGQRQAADPDGSLLALGYQAAPEQERERMRAAMAEAGELDLVRVVAGSGPRARPVTPDESRYLTRQLAGRAGWDDLWRLVRGLPLADAVAAVQAFPDGWRPSQEPDHALFVQLARADPEKIASARASILASAVAWSADQADICHGSISPDGRQLAVVRDQRFKGTLLELIDLPGGAVAGREELDVYSPSRVLHLGEAIIALGHYGGDFLLRYAGGVLNQIFPSDLFPSPGLTHVNDIWACPGGFMAWLRPDTEPKLRPAEVADECLRFWTAAGLVVRDTPLAGREVPRAAEPGSGLLLATKSGELLIVDGHPAGVPQVTGSAASEGHLEQAVFAGPDRLVTCRSRTGVVGLWHITDGTPECRVRRDIKAVSLAWVPDHRVIAALCAETETGTVQLLDVESLETLAEMHSLAGQEKWPELHRKEPSPFRPLRDWAAHAWAAASGRYLAVGRGQGVSVADVAAPVLAGRPLSAMTAADLALAAALLRDPRTLPPALPFLELLTGVLAVGGEDSA